MDVGIVAIRGLGSNLYLALSKRGELYGAVGVLHQTSIKIHLEFSLGFFFKLGLWDYLVSHNGVLK